jgi:hypothetical protein
MEEKEDAFRLDGLGGEAMEEKVGCQAPFFSLVTVVFFLGNIPLYG